MFLAEAAAAAETSNFNGFDVFVILFTIIIGIGVIRLLAAPRKNKFAIGFGLVSLATFLFMDVVMVLHWAGQM